MSWLASGLVWALVGCDDAASTDTSRGDVIDDVAVSAGTAAASQSGTTGGDGAAAPADDGLVSIAARLSPDQPRIGDLLRYEVTAAFSAGVSVNLPHGLKLAPYEVVSAQPMPAESSGSGARKRFVITLQYFDVAGRPIPSFELTATDATGRVQAVRVPAFDVEVHALLANENDPSPRDHGQPVSPEYPAHTAERAIQVGVTALLAGFVLAVLWARWRRRERVVPLPPPRPAHEVAYERLNALEQQDPLGQGDAAAHFLALTEITKGYLEQRFRTPAVDRTTDELRLVLLREPQRFAPLSADEVMRMLRRFDLIKFARVAPDAAEGRAALEGVRALVERATSAGEAASEAASGATAASASEASEAVTASAAQDASTRRDAGGEERP